MSGDIWSSTRLSPPLEIGVIGDSLAIDAPKKGDSGRSPFQKDHDRILFSTPVRRLSDKTQVWPMDENDGVRTRLTHSHEVANLARSIGSQISKLKPDIFEPADLYKTVQPILCGIGLAHDLGNPPFGHQGEAAVKRWFHHRKGWIFSKVDCHDHSEVLKELFPEEWQREFLEFDGNPQSLRLLAKLQASVARVGLDLTAATLAASLKYPVGANNLDKENPIAKKVGYFQSERELVEWFRSQTGISEGERHPLTWIMEACDDIAYSVLDVDDAMKKSVVSPDDVLEILKQTDEVPNGLINQIQGSFAKVAATKRWPQISRDVKIGYLKAHFLDALVERATAAFISNSSAIMARTHRTPLMHKDTLCDTLEDLAKNYAFANSGVLRMEATGADALDTLLTRFWSAISNREKFDDLRSRRKTAIDAYVFSLVSPNYLEDAVLSRKSDGVAGTMRYRELRLLTDMIAGMTDSFAIRLAKQIRGMV